VDLKQEKVRLKTAFTRTRRRLLVLLQQADVTVEQIDDVSEQLNMSMEETMEAMARLSTKYKIEKDSKNNEKLSSEIEQIEVEFTDAQNHVQKVCDELRDRVVYSKFVEALNRQQPLSVDKSVMNSLPIQSDLRLSESAEEQHTVINSQSAACNVTDRQFSRQIFEPVYNSEGASQTTTKTQLIGQDRSEYNRMATVPYSVRDYHPPVVETMNQGTYSQPLPLVSGGIQSQSVNQGTYSQPFMSGNIQSQSNSTLIGQDLRKQIKRVSVPTFSGNKKVCQNWKAAFTACIDQAPATAEYKLLQLKQYLAGEALKAIENLGHSAAAYEVAKERLERNLVVSIDRLLFI